jgi:hypothetical protein
MAKKPRSTSQRGQWTKAGFIPAELSESDIPDYVVIELRYEAPVAFSAAKFAAPAADAPQAESLNNILAKFEIASMRFAVWPSRVGGQVPHRSGGHPAR